MSALRVLELVQIAEIEMLLDTIIGDLHGKEKELLLNESKEKIATREKALARAKELLLNESKEKIATREKA